MLTMDVQQPTKKQVAIEVPTDWGMCTRGDAHLTMLAQRACDAAIQYQRSQEGRPEEICYQFVRGWIRMQAEYRQASHLAIKILVGAFHYQLSMAMTGQPCCARDMWEMNYMKALSQ
jgi:hypothetical protein